MDIGIGWLWAIAGLLLLLAELLSPGFYLLWLGLAALLVAMLLALVDLSIQGQMLAFVICGIGTSVAGWVYYRRQRQMGAPVSASLNETSLQMLGSVGEIIEVTDSGTSKVRIRDSVWLANAAGLPPGTPVRVTGQDGVVLEVERLART